MRFLFLLVLTVLLGLPALAEDAPVDSEDLAPVITGGRTNLDTARIIALQTVPGEIVETSGYKDEDRYFHEILVQTPLGSLYEVEIDSDNGGIYRIEVERYIVGSRVPENLVAKEMAESIALSYIKEETLGRGRTKVLDSILSVHNRKFAYKVGVKKSARIYDVIINAYDGNIISEDRRD